MSALQETLDGHVARGTAPGVVAALGYTDGRLEVASAGELAVDAVIRVQSMTKAVVAVATLRLVERGRLDLDDPVQRWLPELRDRQVLSSPDAELGDVMPAQRPITVRHLLTNTSGYGMALEPSPLQDAMRRTRTEAGPEPVALSADAWVAALAELPLAFEPGSGWRYHHSFGLLGVLLSRLVDRPLGEHLASDLFAPLGMGDTGYAVPAGEAERLPAAYRRRGDGSLEQIEPAGEGFYVAPTPFDVSHAELVSTVTDYATFARMAAAGGVHEGQQIVLPSLLRQMIQDQVSAAAKTPESFFPGFWEGTGWGYGVAVQTSGPHRGRYGWSGGLGTDFFVDPDGSFGIVMAQVEMDAEMFVLFGDVMGLLD
ncbi:MAG: serine hydrolase domain-containing protein [Ornithinimicrobium sp.]